MNYTHEEVLERYNQNQIEAKPMRQKESERAEIEKQVQHFLNGGGKIKQIESNLKPTKWESENVKIITAKAKKEKARWKKVKESQGEIFDMVEELVSIYGSPIKLGKATGISSVTIRTYLRRASGISAKNVEKIKRFHSLATKAEGGDQ